MTSLKYFSILAAASAILWSQPVLTSTGSIENEAFCKLTRIAVSDRGLFILDVGDQTVFHYTGEKTACLYPLNYKGGIEYSQKSTEKYFSICSTYAVLTRRRKNNSLILSFIKK